jgi:serine phosphatase RsbU (regulator of sigma subunit)
MNPDSQYSTAPEIGLVSGDLVLILSDGIEEASAPDDSLFGVERILDVVRSHRGEPARSIVQALYVATRHFAGQAPQIDDITAIVVKVL